MPRLKVSLLLGCAMGALAATGNAGYAADAVANPFADWTLELGQAAGFESIIETLMLAAVLDEPPENAEDLGDAMTGATFDRFAGTLEERDAGLATDLRAALADVGEALGEGRVATDDVDAAMALLRQAYDTVVDPALQAAPAFKAAVMTNLLLQPGGVSEGYEDTDAYPLGWAALERVRVLWGELSVGVPAAQAAQVIENFTELSALYPAVDAPPRMVGIGTEDAEPGAQALVGGLETVAAADLYGARDLPALAARLGDVVVVACTSFHAAADAVGLEGIYAAHDRYADLAGLLDVFDPDLKARIETGFDALGIAVEEEVGGSGPAPDAAAAATDAEVDRPAACDQLAADLHQAATTLAN